MLTASLPLAWLINHRQRRPTGLNRRLGLLLGLLVVSLGLFLLAHLVLFKLYLPARYVRMSLPLVFGVAAGLGLELSLRGLAALLRVPARPLFVGLLAAVFGLVLLWYPASYQRLAAGPAGLGGGGRFAGRCRSRPNLRPAGGRGFE